MTKGDKWIHIITLGFASVALVSAGIGYLWSNEDSRTSTLIVQFAYPVTSIDPPAYDDWESVFIGNHIYPRLLPEENKPWIPHVTEKLDVRCVEPNVSALDESCHVIEISYLPTAFVDCLGREFTIAELRGEFERVLKAKAWELPGWSSCHKNENEICVRGKNTQDILRRMKNVYFRFGWSKKKTGDHVFGAGPYCLHANTTPEGGFRNGVLKAHSKVPRFSEIRFHVSQSPNDTFHIALYGSKNLLAGKRRNVQAHTPLAYYVITNPKLAPIALPWNSTRSKGIIRSFLISHEVFFPESAALANLVPAGQALNRDENALSRSKGLFEFIIPDYLPECAKLAESLTAAWSRTSTDGKSKAVCTDIVAYVMGKVVGNKAEWHGFVVGVSASDPGRDSIRIQYFSPFSPDSWTYDYHRPDDLFYLVGLGQSLVTIDSEVVCDIRPNPLGLGDIFVTDLLPCGGKHAGF